LDAILIVLVRFFSAVALGSCNFQKLLSRNDFSAFIHHRAKCIARRDAFLFGGVQCVAGSGQDAWDVYRRMTPYLKAVR